MPSSQMYGNDGSKSKLSFALLTVDFENITIYSSISLKRADHEGIRINNIFLGFLLSALTEVRSYSNGAIASMFIS